MWPKDSFSLQKSERVISWTEQPGPQQEDMLVIRRRHYSISGLVVRFPSVCTHFREEGREAQNDTVV